MTKGCIDVVDKNIFYNTKNMSMAEKRFMLIDCRDISYEWWADTLDCSISWSRQRFDCTFNEILDHLNENAAVVCIDRGTWGSPLGEKREHFEVGFRVMSSPVDYFLFIQVDSDKTPPILEKYKLLPIR